MPWKLSVPLELDKPRTLRLTLGAMKLAEDELKRVYGVPKLNLLALFQRGEVSFTDLLVVMWAGLRHEDPSLTLEQAGELLELEHIGLVSQKITEAFTAALSNGRASESAPTADGADPLTTSSTGSSSGAEAATTSA